MRGVITKVFIDRGFAFARGENGKSYFVHVRSVQPVRDFENLSEGVSVEFDTVETASETSNGLRGTNVRIIASAR